MAVLSLICKKLYRSFAFIATFDSSPNLSVTYSLSVKQIAHRAKRRIPGNGLRTDMYNVFNAFFVQRNVTHRGHG